MSSEQRRLGLVLAVTSIYFAAELAGGYVTNSLALISDAVHLLTDIASNILGMVTLWISSRPTSGSKTYGYLPAEMLGAHINGLFPWLIVVFTVLEAIDWIREPGVICLLRAMPLT